MMTFAYGLQHVSQGWVAAVATEHGLCALVLPRRECRDVELTILRSYPDAVYDQDRFTDILSRLKRYFSGERMEFPDAVDVGTATAFRQEVWRAARQIPYGETRSYAWLAERINRPRAARAVGQALGENPIPLVIPCHRIVGSGGDLRGFADGLEMKASLLALERPRITHRCTTRAADPAYL
ncbi:MAG: methylated-DNA--[protein]-cysteine S-methyltransferase [Chloroflexota bacterium]|nr:MAG: methylated-DNA--[protein]-cysteine S-methyltransferase [Chloroflexota bacterium]